MTTTTSLSKSSSRDVVHQLPPSPPTSSSQHRHQDTQQREQAAAQQRENQNALNLKKSDISLPAMKTTEPVASTADSQKISISSSTSASSSSASSPSPSLRHTRRSSRQSGGGSTDCNRDRSNSDESKGVDDIDEGNDKSTATTIKDKFAGPRGLPKLRVLHRALKSTLRTATSASPGT